MLRIPVICVTVIALGGCASARAAATDELPLAPGTTWTYKGTASGKDVTLTVRVADVHAEGDAVVARLDGDLFDLPFGDGRGASYWIRRGDKLYRARTPKDGGTLWLDGPLAPGKKSCDPDEPKLCWTVTKEDSATLAGVRGVAPVARRRWELVQRDNTGSYRVLVAAGVGICELHYHHNGSPADVDLRLVEMKP